MAIGIDGYLQDTSMADYRHGWLSLWMTTGMAPVTIDTANYRHGGLLAWMAISTDDHLQNIGTADYQHR